MTTRKVKYATVAQLRFIYGCLCGFIFLVHTRNSCSHFLSHFFSSSSGTECLRQDANVFIYKRLTFSVPFCLSERGCVAVWLCGCVTVRVGGQGGGVCMPQQASDPRPPALITLIKAQVHMVGKHLRFVKTHVLIVSTGLRALYGCVP